MGRRSREIPNRDISQDDRGWTVLHNAAHRGLDRELQEEIKRRPQLIDAEDYLGMTPLQVAAQAAQESAVRILLRKGASAQTRDNEDRTALHYAAEGGSSGVIKILLSKGLDVEAQDSKGKRSLHFAASLNQLPATRVLLKEGADSEARCSSRKTPLNCAPQDQENELRSLLLLRKELGPRFHQSPLLFQVAVFYNFVSIVQLLINDGADVGKAAKYELPLLHIAMSQEDEDMTQLLLEEGANVEVRAEGYSMTALQIAICLDHESLTRSLLGFSANRRSTRPWPLEPLLIATSKGNEALVRSLLDEIIEDTPKTLFCKTVALHIAIVRGYKALIPLLLQGNAEVITYCHEEAVSSIVARIEEKSENLKKSRIAIQEAKAKLNADFTKIKFWMSAVVRKALDFDQLHRDGTRSISTMGLEDLANVGASNKQNDMPHISLHSEGPRETCHVLGHFGFSAVELAIVKRRTDILPLLLKEAARHKEHTFQDPELLCLAAFLGYKDETLLLIEQGADINALVVGRSSANWPYRCNALHEAAAAGDKGAVSLLLRHGADGSVVDDRGFTALHFAARAGHTEVVEFLACDKILLEARTPQGKTPLRLAILHQRSETILELLRNHASFDRADKFGNTPLHLCAVDLGIHTTVTSKLLQNGANIQARNRRGATPLHYAAHWKHHEAIQNLLNWGADVKAVTNAGDTPLAYAWDGDDTWEKRRTIRLLRDAENATDQRAAGGISNSQSPNPQVKKKEESSSSHTKRLISRKPNR